MILRILFTALASLSLVACASVPDKESDKEKPDAKYCDTEVGDRNQTEVCRQY